MCAVCVKMTDSIFAVVPQFPRAARSEALVKIIDAVPGWKAAEFESELRRTVTPDVAAYLKPNAPEAVFVHADNYGKTTTLAVFRILAGYAFPAAFIKTAAAHFVAARPEKKFPEHLAPAIGLLYENEYASICRSDLVAHGGTVAIQAVTELVNHPLWRWVEFQSGLIYAGVRDVWSKDFAFLDLLKNRNKHPDIEVERSVALYIFSALRVLGATGTQVMSATVFVLNRHGEQLSERGKRFSLLVSTLYKELSQLKPLPLATLSPTDECPKDIQWGYRG